MAKWEIVLVEERPLESSVKRDGVAVGYIQGVQVVMDILDLHNYVVVQCLGGDAVVKGGLNIGADGEIPHKTIGVEVRI